MASADSKVVSDVVKALSRPPPVVSSADDRPADNLHQVRQRQKQIDQVLFSLPQDRYDFAMPRKRRANGDPVPPSPWRQCAKRKWDARTLDWRRKMHAFDIGVDIDSRHPPALATATDAADLGGSSCKVKMPAAFMRVLILPTCLLPRQMCPRHALDLLGWLYADALPPPQDPPSQRSAPAAAPCRLSAMGPPPAHVVIGMAAGAPAPRSGRFDALHDPLLSSGGPGALAAYREGLRSRMSATVTAQAAAASRRRERWAAFLAAGDEGAAASVHGDAAGGGGRGAF